MPAEAKRVVLGGSTVAALAAIALWLTLTVAALVRATGGAVSGTEALLCAVVGAPIAFIFAIHTIAALWRGPTVQSFARDDSVACTADEAAYIRVVSQLRGTMGGAGFIYPKRLLFPALSWLALSAAGVAVDSQDIDPGIFGALALLAVALACAALLLPARPYFYREITDGKAILSPPSAAWRLKQRAAIANALSAGEQLDLTTPPPTPLPRPALTPTSSTPRDGAP